MGFKDPFFEKERVFAVLFKIMLNSNGILSIFSIKIRISIVDLKNRFTYIQTYFSKLSCRQFWYAYKFLEPLLLKQLGQYDLLICLSRKTMSDKFLITKLHIFDRII